MWVCLSNAFLSIVAHRDSPKLLLVRARVEGDIERVFPLAEVKRTPNGDYLFRAPILRADVKLAMEAEISKIDYDNFKNSVPEHDRHDTYLEMWGSMNRLQRARQLGSKRKVTARR